MDLFERIAFFQKLVGLKKIAQDNQQEAIKSLLDEGQPKPEELGVETAIQSATNQLTNPNRNWAQDEILIRSLATRLKGQNLTNYTEQLDNLFNLSSVRPYRQIFDAILRGKTSTETQTNLPSSPKFNPVSPARRRTFELVKQNLNNYLEQLKTLGPDPSNRENISTYYQFKNLQEQVFRYVTAPLADILSNLQDSKSSDPEFTAEVEDLLTQAGQFFPSEEK